MPFRVIAFLAALTCLLPTGQARAQDTRQAAWTGATSASLTLYREPSAASATARVIPPGTEVDVFRRRGEWLEIRTRDASALEGWVSYDGVRRVAQPASQASRPAQASGQAAGGAPPPPPAQSGGFFSNLARGVTRLLGGSPPASQQGTVTVGVRGLAAEDLAAATPDPAEVERMEGYRASRDQAYQFASRSRLAAQTVDYLPESSSAGAAGEPPGAAAGAQDR